MHSLPRVAPVQRKTLQSSRRSVPAREPCKGRAGLQLFKGKLWRPYLLAQLLHSSENTWPEVWQSSMLHCPPEAQKHIRNVRDVLLLGRQVLLC